jgi:hypothetical protein
MGGSTKGCSRGRTGLFLRHCWQRGGCAQVPSRELQPKKKTEVISKISGKGTGNLLTSPPWPLGMARGGHRTRERHVMWQVNSHGRVDERVRSCGRRSRLRRWRGGHSIGRGAYLAGVLKMTPLVTAVTIKTPRMYRRHAARGRTLGATTARASSQCDLERTRVC